MALKYAPDDDPKLFGDTSSGYVVSSTQGAVQANFFSSRVNQSTGIGGFDPKLLEYAFSIRSPVAAPEPGSVFVLLLDNPIAPEYSGPVQFLLGEFDFAICRGDCRNTYNTTKVHGMYPKAKAIDIYLQPGTGHGLPFHNGAQIGFQKTFDWLSENGF